MTWEHPAPAAEHPFLGHGDTCGSLIAASAAHLLWGQGEGGRLASEIRHREVERCHFATRNMLVNSKLP